MSTGNNTSIYTGLWVNWSRGLVLGSTITLSSRNGAILTAFIATFVTIVGAQLWKVVCFLLHQSRSSQAPRDGLYHQHQNVFRNSVSASSAAWSFMLQTWYWWGHTRRTWMRSLPWMLFSVAYLVVFAALSIFASSEIVRAAGSDRLIRSSQCGLWLSDRTQPGLTAYESKVLIDNQNAATYARNCYVEPADALYCNQYATPNLRFEASDANCPFQDGMCWKNHTYRLDTGFMDSHHDLGINTAAQDRLKYRRVATCTVLKDGDYINVTDASNIVTWNYGPFDRWPHTLQYNPNALKARIGYTVSGNTATLGEEGGWKPIAGLNRTDADVDIISVAGNSILYRTPVDDPVFAAHLLSNVNLTDDQGQFYRFYESDYYASVIGCINQHQVCHRDTCTELSGRLPVFSDFPGLTEVQKGIFLRLAYSAIFSGIYQVIHGRSGASLRASDTVVEISQYSLPPDQWKTEVSSWFATGLAVLQHTLRDYVDVTNMRPPMSIVEPASPVEESMCHNQKTQIRNGTVSFSLMGLAALFIIGGLLILLSFVLEPIVAWIGPASYLNWKLDDTMQLQRMAFEARGVRWAKTDGAIPVTEPGQIFPSVASVPESQPLMSQDEKKTRVDVRETA